MHYLYFSKEEQETYPVTFLVPQIRKDDLKKHYITPYGVNEDEVLVLGLHYAPGKKKTPMAEMRRYLEEVICPVLKDAGTKYVMVADADYFKALTKAAKADVHLGYLLDSAMGDFKVIYVPNYKAKFYDPIKVTAKIDMSMEALVAAQGGNYQAPGSGIIHFAQYPTEVADIAQWLKKLLAMNCPLTFDIEAFDLKHHKAGIGTISIAWNEHEGIAFPVDYTDDPWIEVVGDNEIQHYGRQVYNTEVRALLKEFFQSYQQKAIYHNIAFDAYVLVYQLFMEDILDTEGLLNGIDCMLRNWDCTKLISYLATNSCSGNRLSLKDQAHEFAGNYAMDSEDIKDITRIPRPKLLEYNLVDSLATWFVHKKRKPQMLADQQEEIYETIFKPATKDILQMQLTGMPINMKRVKEVKQILLTEEKRAISLIQGSPLVQRFTHQANEALVIKKNKEYKKKVITIADVNEVFNPNSPDQLVDLLFNMLGLPIISRTKTKQPSADGDTLKALLNHTADPEIKTLLQALQDFKDVNKILTTFIVAMEGAALGSDGWYYLFGNYNLGGTVSGRLSSSKPNMQNLPASSRYAKLIKSCFEAPPGWLFMGLDFASLEDRISALTTKDPNKLRVYTDGYDGHCLRTFAYFRDQLPDIVDTVESINSIQKKYGELRSESKAPTFALTYQGTYITLMANCGFSEAKAKSVEKNYHGLYVVSDQWIAAKLDQASKDGYITTAFGLRVRTPLLHQVIRGNSRTPFEAEAEGRTAGNALGQGWCLLNSRAASEFMGKVRDSEYRLDIRPCAQIHDASYYLIRDDIDAVMYTNEHLVKAVKWQDHPDIYHPDVGLGGDLSLFWPHWGKEAEIPNEASEEEIRHIIEQHVTSLHP